MGSEAGIGIVMKSHAWHYFYPILILILYVFAAKRGGSRKKLGKWERNAL